ncbi:MAG: AmmeMemoRadiSam system protein A [Gammaproteobacteria bacterium]|nr:AmmeMemoRadiSam system protein A [Gammaproteobacteria bacterium]MBU1447034.1 AmmeMemoRadiSam system protein A [Gammaproteobacteria bacterium]MDD2928798.1 AmmeMemoRadiSam system protein A [Sideroxydans sp.]MDD5470598.1 AmmeMemoRadiSam system protein A [Sideroxydans sp.]
MNEIQHGLTLLRLARAAIASELGFDSHDLPRSDWLEQERATFVTLNLHGRLRGCIGSLEAHRPLIDDVRHNAVAAAFRDPRFPPLNREEFAEVTIEVSLLSPAEPIRFDSESDALSQLRPGQDGVILEYGRSRATYLPQVWAQLPEPRDFIGNLKEKAGLPADFWSDDIRLSRYSVRKYSEGVSDG